MLDHETRSAILRLSREGHGSRFIARAVGVARKSVLKVLARGRAEVPEIERPDQLSAQLERIRELHAACRGNLVRVHEELEARDGLRVAYSTLTRFCRDAEIGVAPKQASGRYEFGPGEEMQHDTSPHTVEVGGRRMSLQCASLVFCFSRCRFIQCYPRWTRFHVDQRRRPLEEPRELCWCGGAEVVGRSHASATSMAGVGLHQVPPWSQRHLSSDAGQTLRSRPSVRDKKTEVGGA